MPCNRVAIRRARVSAAHIASLLTTERLLSVIKAYVEAKMGEIGSELPDRTIELREASSHQICYRLGGYYGIDIFVKAGGEIEISHTYPEQASLDAALTQELLTIMSALGVNLLKAEAAQFVEANFGIEEQYHRPDGTLVINFNC